MTTDCLSFTVVDPDGIVRGDLLDALVEVVIHARGPAARAEVISELVQEICATVEWLHHNGTQLDDSPADELMGITRLSEAAHDHQRHMRALARQPKGLHSSLYRRPRPMTIPQ